MSFRKSSFVLAGCLLVFSADAAMAELRVQRCSPGIKSPCKVGARLPDGYRFSLRPGEWITLWRSKGGQVTLRGPGTGTVDTLAKPQSRPRSNTARVGTG